MSDFDDLDEAGAFDDDDDEGSDIALESNEVRVKEVRVDDALVRRKERAKEQRRAAYLRAKELRAKDPKHLAMKAVVKARRRELYQQAKERNKAVRAEAKAREQAKKAAEREVSDKELMKLVRVMSKGSDADN